MFEQVSADLERAVDALDIPVDGAALVQCFQLLDRLQAKVTCAVGAFHAAEAWKDTGATSMTAWLVDRTRRSHREASTWARTGRRMSELPSTAAAYQDGTLAGGQVQAIVANLNDRTTPLFHEAEDELVPLLADLDVRDVSAVMQRWAQAARDSLDEPEPTTPHRSLFVSRTLGGRRELSGSLDAEGGALTEIALRLAATVDGDGEPERTPAHRRADALVDIMRWFLDHQHDKLGGRHRPHLNVFLDQDDLPCPSTGVESPTGRPAATRSGWLPDGSILDSVTIDRLTCDCAIHRVVHQGRSSILDYGMSVRTAPPNLFNAIVARDRGCRFPGCDRPAEWCEAHHIPAVEDGGPTSITTMALLCSRHHHLVHSPGWHNKLQPDGTYTITDPHGHTRTTHPPHHRSDLFTRPPP